MASLILAIRFLTILPVPGREAHGPGALGRAASWFPAVGLGLGGVLALTDRGLSLLFPPLVTAALLVAFWKILTGGIHLDGLADCLDGLAGRDHAHRRAIMKDSRIGVFGVIGLALILLLTWAALAETPGDLRGRVLFFAPVVGRVMPLGIGWWYRDRAVPGGLGAEFASGVSPGSGISWKIVIILLASFLLWPLGVFMWFVALVTVAVWSELLVERFGGLTGDVLGSGVEVSELACLLTAVSLSHLRAQ